MYAIEVVKRGKPLYYNPTLVPVPYVPISQVSVTTDLVQLAGWEEYVKNDLTNGTITSYRFVKLQPQAVPVQLDLKPEVARRALTKLTDLEKDALGL